jgi:hypothetical protein
MPIIWACQNWFTSTKQEPVWVTSFTSLVSRRKQDKGYGECFYSGNFPHLINFFSPSLSPMDHAREEIYHSSRSCFWLHLQTTSVCKQFMESICTVKNYICCSISDPPLSPFGHAKQLAHCSRRSGLWPPLSSAAVCKKDMGYVKYFIQL